MVILVTSRFGFEGGTLVLIASVPGHCLLFTFDKFAVNRSSSLAPLSVSTTDLC